MGSCHSKKKKTSPVANGTILSNAAAEFAKALDDEKALRKVLLHRAQKHKVQAAAITYVNAKGKSTSAFIGNNVDENALFQAASTSKAVAAAAILTLAEQRGISFDEDIRTYVTSLDIAKEIQGGDRGPVTLRQLFSHTAGATVHGYVGYPRAIPKRFLPNTKEIIRGFPRANSLAVQLTGKKGAFSYSGGGYMIAQLFAQDVSGKPLDQLVQELILGPLRMTQSCFTQPLVLPPTAKVHIIPAKPSLWRRLLRIPPTWHTYPEQAPAGLWTTPQDYALFVAALLEDSPISQSVVHAMRTPVAQDYGLGLGLSFHENQQLFSIHHTGSNPPAYRCAFAGFCIDQSRIVVMTNSPSGDDLCQEALEGAALLARKQLVQL